MKKKALVIGVSGQDGYYLARLLLRKNYEVHGTVRRAQCGTDISRDHQLIEEAKQNPITLHHCDLSDYQNCLRLVEKLRPDEIYNLGAQTHVQISFEAPLYTGDINGLGALRILEAIRTSSMRGKTRYFQASSSEIYGTSRSFPQNEETPRIPRSPYGIAKLYAHSVTVSYRESYGLHASNGIMFNHESPRRQEIFVSRKIARGAARIKCGLQTSLTLGRLSSFRDWGYAPEYVEAMWLMLQQDAADDYVIATNESHSVQEFCYEAFRYLGLDWQEYVLYDKSFDRPMQIDRQQGNPSKALDRLQWTPKTKFKELVALMVEHELHEA